MYVEDTPTGPIQLIPAAAAAGQPVAHPAGPTPRAPHAAQGGAPARGDYAVITPGTTPAPAAWLPQPQNAPQHAAGQGSAVCGPHSAQTLIRRPEQAVTRHETPQTALEQQGQEDESPTGRAWVRQRFQAVGVDRLPEAITAAQPALIDRIRYSTHGDWTTRPDGPARRAHRAWTYVVTVPVTATSYLLVWAVERPMRCLFLLISALIIGTALGQLPLIEFVIPDIVNILAWF